MVLQRQLEQEGEERRKADLKKKEPSKRPIAAPREFVTAEIPAAIDSVNYPDPNLDATPSAPELPPSYEKYSHKPVNFLGLSGLVSATLFPRFPLSTEAKSPRLTP